MIDKIEQKNDKIEADARYRAISELTSDFAYACLMGADNRFHFEWLTGAFQQITGYAEDEIETRGGWPALVHPADWPQTQNQMSATPLGETNVTEIRILTRNGDIRWIRNTFRHFKDADGRQKFWGAAQDITAQKRAELFVEKLAAFPRLNPNPVLEFSAEGTLTYFNAATMELAKLIGKKDPATILPPQIHHIIKECLNSGKKRMQFETVLAGRTIAWSFFPIISSRVVHCYAVDITDRLNLEAQFRQAQKMESVGKMAAGVAHDFSNILTIMQGHATMLLAQGNRSAEEQEALEQIAEAAVRGAHLTDQLLAFSRKQTMRLQVLDVNEAIGKVCKLLYRLIRENITLDISFGSDLPAIKADAGMIEQALVNLVLNARDAMGSDGGKIQIDTILSEANSEFCMEHAEAKPGNYVCIRVKDTGCGIDPAHLEHIFEPFFTTKESERNSGLGLATVYGILKQHSGWINVSSEPGQGSTFHLYFPATHEEAPKTAAASTAPAKASRGHETILLVEDDEALRRMAKAILSKAGYRVIEASDGPHALDLWQNNGQHIDLLLADLVMPKGVSGKQLADQLRAAKPNLKAVYMSGYTMDLNEEDLGLDANTRFLPKPFQPDKVVRFIRDCLDNTAEASL